MGGYFFLTDISLHCQKKSYKILFSIIYPYFLPVATFCGLVAWGGSYRPRNVHPRTRLSDPEISRVSTSKTQKTFTKPTSKLQFCSFLTKQPKMIFLEFRIFKIKHCTVQYMYIRSNHVKNLLIQEWHINYICTHVMCTYEQLNI